MAICDFEQALVSAMETASLCSSQGMLFPLHKEPVEENMELGLAGSYRHDRNLRQCMHKVMAIGYLPLALVQMDLNMLHARMSTNHLINTYPALITIFLYVMNTYFNGTFSPPLENVYNCNMYEHTNNNIESK